MINVAKMAIKDGMARTTIKARKRNFSKKSKKAYDTNIYRMAQIKVSRIAKVAKLAKLARIAKMDRMAKKSRNTKMSKKAEIDRMVKWQKWPK